MQKLDWELLGTEAIAYEATAELLEEINSLRVKEVRERKANKPLNATISEIANSVLSLAPRVAGLEQPLFCTAAMYGVLEKLAFELPELAPTQATQFPAVIPVFDFQAAIRRHAFETERLAELARLRARDEYQATKQADVVRSNIQAATPDPTPVEAQAMMPPAPAWGSNGQKKVWTDERKAAVREYRKVHGLKLTAEFYGVSQATISKHVPAEKEVSAEGYSVFSHRTK